MMGEAPCAPCALVTEAPGAKAGHNLELLRMLASFCENYAKLYFDAKHLEQGLNRGC